MQNISTKAPTFSYWTAVDGTLSNKTNWTLGAHYYATEVEAALAASKALERGATYVKITRSEAIFCK